MQNHVAKVAAPTSKMLQGALIVYTTTYSDYQSMVLNIKQ